MLKLQWPLPEPAALEARKIKALVAAGKRHQVAEDLAVHLAGFLEWVRPFWFDSGFCMVTPERIEFRGNQGELRSSVPLPPQRLAKLELTRLLHDGRQLWSAIELTGKERKRIGLVASPQGSYCKWGKCDFGEDADWLEVEQLQHQDILLAGTRYHTAHHEDIIEERAVVISASGGARFVDYATRPRGSSRPSQRPRTYFAPPALLPDGALGFTGEQGFFPAELPSDRQLLRLARYFSRAGRDAGRVLATEAFSGTELVVCYWPQTPSSSGA
jgi:hypothetical protein